MSSLAFYDSFDYLCYGHTVIRNIFTLTVRGSTLVVRIYRRQNLSTNVDPRTVKVNELQT